MLENTVFHVLQSIMVVIKLGLNLFEVETILSILVPWQIEHGVKVGILS